MPFDLQTRLLRVLSDGNFYRVGGHNPLRANVRVIAATHQNLETRVKEGLFREDLFHRLNVIRLRLPPLRERPEDITLLARHFLQKSAKELGVEPKRMSDDALGYVSTLPFPGNVRQLENLCNWLTVMAPAQTIEVKDLPREMIDAGHGDSLSVARPINDPRPGVPEYDAPDAADYAMNAGVGDGDTMLATRPQTVAPSAAVAPSYAAAALSQSWENLLAGEAKTMLESGQTEVMDVLTRRFEKAVLEAALGVTRGRRVEAATRLGIGRNTITRKLDPQPHPLPLCPIAWARGAGSAISQKPFARSTRSAISANPSPPADSVM
jgi:two-component system nitrogen regulation response regulator GlnG